MRTLFQTIKQQFLEGNDLVLVSVKIGRAHV